MSGSAGGDADDADDEQKKKKRKRKGNEKEKRVGSGVRRASRGGGREGSECLV